MTATHKNRLKTAISAVASAGLGALTIDAAASGYRTFGAGDDGLTFDGVLIVEGTAWEVRDGCVYTHSGTSLSRGTLMDSSTGSAVAFTSAAVVSQGGSADLARRMESAALNTVLSSADANITMTVGTLHGVDISGYTANRTATLPAVAAVDDRCGLYLTAGDDTYGLLYTAASGDTLKGVAGGTEVSRLIITGELVIFRCTVANTTWIVERDGRIAQQCDMQLTTNADGESANTFTRPTQAATPGAWTAQIDNASLSTPASDRITARRAGNFDCIASGRSKDAPATGKYYNVALYKNAGATLVLLGQAVTSSTGQNPLAANARLIPLAADEYLVFQYRNQDAALGCQADQSWFSIKEVL